jgi:hypothetical protein
MKLKSAFVTSVILGLLLVGASAVDLQIDPAKIDSTDDIPGWEIFKYVKEGTVALETVGDDKALKLSTDPGDKGLMLIVKDAVDCNKGGKITFVFSAKGAGRLGGGAYLLDGAGKTIGGIYTPVKDVKSDDEWAEFHDEKDIPTEVDGLIVAKVQPYLKVLPESEVSLKSLDCKISGN